MWNTSSRVLWQRTKHFLCKSGFLYIWLKFDIITLPTYLFWDVEYLHSKNKFSLTVNNIFLLEQMTCLSWKVALDWRDSNCIKVVLLRWHIKLVPSSKNTGTNRNLSFNYHFVFQQIFDERTLQRGQHKWVFSWLVLSFLDKALHNIPPTWFGYCAVNFQPDFRWLDEEAEVITGDGQSCVKITYICFTLPKLSSNLWYFVVLLNIRKVKRKIHEWYRNGTSLLLEQTTFTKVYVCVLYIIVHF